MNKILKSKFFVSGSIMALALSGFVLFANDAIAASGEGTATINAAANATVNAGASTVFTVLLTVGASGISPTADNPTFTIPTGFTAPTGTPVANVGAVTTGVDGNWFAGATGGTCAAVGTTATGQVITVDVTAQCATTNTITLTYKGTSNTVGAAAPLVITTDDVAGGTASIAIATPPTITVASSASGQGTATVSPTSVTATTSNTFTAVLTVGAAGITATADSPTFTIPVGFTAPSATAVANAAAVVADGNWSAVGAGGTCAVTTGTSTATGQVMTVDVTGAGCVAGNTITLTYKGTKATPAAVASLVITTDDVTGGTAGTAIATPPTITVLAAAGQGTATVSPSAVGVSTSNTFTVALTVGANGITATADNPTFTIPAGFTAPTAAPAASLAAVTADGMWFVSATGATCTVGLVSPTAAAGQVITADVTGACVSGDVITLTYKGTAPVAPVAASILTTTDVAAGGDAAALIAVSPTITVGALPAGGGGLTSGGGGTTNTDTTAPINTSISINNGATTTSNLSVNLTLSASDSVGVTQMMIGNDSSFNGATWEPYMTSKSWMLTSGDGMKTVYAEFRDAAGNMSAAVSGSITLSSSGTVVATCSSGMMLNSVTGMCVTLPPVPVSIPGCVSNVGYSPTTGQSCLTNNVFNQLMSIPGCGNSNTGFSNTSGMSCANNLVMQSTVIPGCGNSNMGFSNTSGMSCANNYVYPTQPVTLNAQGENAFPTSYDFGTATLKVGSKGDAVEELQEFLNRFMNLGLALDASFGPKTAVVIKQWQSQNGLVADGLVGAKTKAMMNTWAATR